MSSETRNHTCAYNIYYSSISGMSEKTFAEFHLCIKERSWVKEQSEKIYTNCTNIQSHILILSPFIETIYQLNIDTTNYHKYLQWSLIILRKNFDIYVIESHYFPKFQVYSFSLENMNKEYNTKSCTKFMFLKFRRYLNLIQCYSQSSMPQIVVFVYQPFTKRRIEIIYQNVLLQFFYTATCVDKYKQERTYLSKCFITTFLRYLVSILLITCKFAIKRKVNVRFGKFCFS